MYPTSKSCCNHIAPITVLWIEGYTAKEESWGHPGYCGKFYKSVPDIKLVQKYGPGDK